MEFSVQVTFVESLVAEFGAAEERAIAQTPEGATSASAQHGRSLRGYEAMNMIRKGRSSGSC